MPIVRSKLDAAGAPGEEGFRAIYIEVDQVRDVEPASIYAEVETRAEPAEKVVTLARDVFGEGVELARSCAARVARGLTGLPDTMKPDEFELQLAIKEEHLGMTGFLAESAHHGCHLAVLVRQSARLQAIEPRHERGHPYWHAVARVLTQVEGLPEPLHLASFRWRGHRGDPAGSQAEADSYLRRPECLTSTSILGPVL